MTTALLLTFGMALSTSVMADLPSRQQVHIQVAVFKGDPLGSRAEGTVKTLAEPALRVLANQTATFQSGGQTPVPGADGTISYEPTGLTLKLTPFLKADGEVLLDVDAQITDVAPGRGITLGNGQVVPAFNKQTIQTRRSLKDTQTVRVRMGATSPTDQTWVELTVHVVR